MKGVGRAVLRPFYADMHIHIGRTEAGDPVKITGSRNLTFYNIAHEASERKGIDIVGIIDCHSPVVQHEIESYLERGEMVELDEGGIRFRQTTILLGSEIEVRDEGMGPAHLLAYFPNLAMIKDFTSWMSEHMKNVTLSSQRIYVPARVLQEEVVGRGGMMIPAHVFTPHRSVYGSCSNRMAHLLDLEHVAAVELGLSSDTTMASYISELDPFTFLTNSDAHSLGKIGREYNELQLAAANYAEFSKALSQQDGRRIVANYGLNPRLGKYYRTFCAQCESIIDEQEVTVTRCLYCGSLKIVRGVMDRIMEVSDRETARVPAHKAPYHYQVPLEFIPGLGKRRMAQLLSRFGTEMSILHEAKAEELITVVGEDIASYILLARDGKLSLDAGGGGHYGKVSPLL